MEAPLALEVIMKELQDEELGKQNECAEEEVTAGGGDSPPKKEEILHRTDKGSF